jgi:hypothetical protein
MAYLNSSTVVVDAILTTKGRELMARNDGSFKLTQFALSDDEIDYTLYNSSHPSGSSFYGEAIQNMPLLQAFPDETQDLKYKLITLPRGTAKLPILDLGTGAIILKQGASLTLSPQTLNYLGNTSVFENSGYTLTVADVRLLSTLSGIGVGTQEVNLTNNQATLGTSISKTVVGTSFNLTATTVNNLFGSTNTQLVTTIIVTGRDSGARITIPLKINKTTN